MGIHALAFPCKKGEKNQRGLHPVVFISMYLNDDASRPRSIVGLDGGVMRLPRPFPVPVWVLPRSEKDKDNNKDSWV